MGRYPTVCLFPLSAGLSRVKVKRHKNPKVYCLFEHSRPSSHFAADAPVLFSCPACHHGTSTQRCTTTPLPFAVGAKELLLSGIRPAGLLLRLFILRPG